MKFEDKVARLRIEKYKGKETEAFLNDIKIMADGEPFEYILGEVSFCGARIDLSRRPMIPRKEAEYWVGQAIKEIQDKRYKMKDEGSLHAQAGLHAQVGKRQKANSKGFRALDLFSGSGCIGIAIAKNIPEAHVDMIERKPELREQIELSCALNHIEERTQVMTGDILDGATGLYDCITAVPPYVPPHMKEEVMKELHAEDPTYFFDKEDGMYYHKEVLAYATTFLKQGGRLYLEGDMTQRDALKELAQELGFARISFLKDPYGYECVLCIANST